MRSQGRAAAAALVTAMVLTSTPTATAATADGSGPAVAPVPGGRGATVTLLTGDRVVLGAGGDVLAVRRGKGRERVRFVSWAAGEARYVVPTDAEPLLRAARLDLRLFDVRGLAQAGYDDEARDTLPLIVTQGGGAARSAIATAGARVTRDLPTIGGSAITIHKRQGVEWWSTIAGGPSALRAGAEKIWLDGRRAMALDRSVPQIGAPAAWQAGYTGRGVTVAVLDSGVDTTHPDLAGRVREVRNFSSEPDATDTLGHGTHVASTIAGSGAASGGRYRGVAPDADLIAGKVCGLAGCQESAIIAGMQWAAAEQHASVVNLSLGGTDGPEMDPVEEAVNTLTAEHGTLFVVSAGNRGPADGTVESPGSAEAALTVGAVDRSDALARFSARGPRTGDDGLKPDITAPGVDIVAARASGTEIGTVVSDRYMMLSGTSMATPHVAGAAALLAQRHPDWTAQRLKATLMGAARPNPTQSGYQQGAGRADVGRAIGQAVTTDPPSVSYGRTTWPHGDDEPVARTIAYHNDGTAPVTLDLALRIAGPGGTSAPAGLFTSSAGRITVPAGGTTQVTVTADTRVAGPDGLYSGQLLATGGGLAVSTPLSVNKEPPTYELAITNLDSTGARTSAFSTYVYGLDSDEDDSHVDHDGDGTVRIRLPQGRYGALSWIFEGDGARSTTVAWPAVDLTRDTALTLDARQGRPVSTTVPQAAARPQAAQLWYAHYSADPFVNPSAFGTHFTFFLDDFDGYYTAQLGDPVPQDWVRTYVTSQWARPDGSGGFTGSPYLYAVGEMIEGRLPTGFRRDYTRDDLATVRQRFGAAAPGLMAERSVGIYFGATSFLPVSLPSERVEYYNHGAEIASTDLSFETGGALLSTQTHYRYQPGRQYHEEWNEGPSGPSLAGALYDVEWVTRRGDVITASPPLFGDRYGHPGIGFPYDTARVALYRDGALVKETPRVADSFLVPEEPGTYRLEVSATRSTELSTHVSSVWTFQSRHIDGDAAARLPVQVVRFTPPLDQRGTAPAGRHFEIPVTVKGQDGVPAVDVTRLTLHISHDGGRTWRPASLRATEAGWTATVVHPAGEGLVSLRATATDSAGGTVTQTIINAYRIAPTAP